MTDRIILDTNILISYALSYHSIPGQVAERAIQKGWALYSEETILELVETLSKEKFNAYITEAEKEAFLTKLLPRLHEINTTHIVTACRDEKDNKFLELALSGKADYIITGDQDLLTLNPFQGVEIIQPRGYLELLH